MVKKKKKERKTIYRDVNQVACIQFISNTISQKLYLTQLTLQSTFISHDKQLNIVPTH